MTEANKKSEIEIVAKVEHARHCANFIKENENFAIDRSKEDFLLTWNPCGFLKRIK